MAKVVPTEGGDPTGVTSGPDKDRAATDLVSEDIAVVPQQEEKEGNANVAQAPTEDSPRIDQLPGPPSSAAGEECHRSSLGGQSGGAVSNEQKPGDVSSVAVTGRDDTAELPSDGTKPSVSEEGQQKAQDNVGSNEPTAEGDARAGPIPLDPEVDKHGGSLSSPFVDTTGLGKPNPQLAVAVAQVTTEEGMEHANISGTSSMSESREVSDEESEPPGAPFSRRGTRMVIRQSSTADGMTTGVIGKKSGKRDPFVVPQTMFMGHPLGSTAAEFLERHKYRVQEIRAKREDVDAVMKLVMDHDPASSGSPLPDIDAVFPDNRSDGDQGDRYI